MSATMPASQPVFMVHFICVGVYLDIFLYEGVSSPGVGVQPFVSCHVGDEN